MSETVTEARGTTSRMQTIRALLNKAEGASTDAERDAYTRKAAELMARYSIDEAMLSDSRPEADKVVDRVIWTDRPFSKRMADLLWFIAEPKGAQARSVREHTGNEREGALKWRHGLRVFAHESDLRMIEMMYTTARNLALAGASRIRGYDTYGQDQKAHRESYIEGFSHGIYSQMRAAQAEAERVAEAEREQLEEQALLRGEIAPGRSVELVLASRRDVVKNAMHLALYGKTTAQLAAERKASDEHWAEYDRKAREHREREIEEQRSCQRCRDAKSGYCNGHRHMRPSRASYRSYERVGAYYGDGYQDGRTASLGNQRNQVSGTGRQAIG